MSRTAHTRIALLDGFCLDLSGRPADADKLPRGVQRLLAHISLMGRPGREATAGELWPDVSEGNAQSSLRSTLWRLHKCLPGVVEVSGGSLRLADGVRVDVREMREWARQVFDPVVQHDHLILPDFAQRGELLPGWYDDWVLLERERLRQLRMHALEALADKLLACGRFADAVQAAIAAVRAEPLRESARRAVIRVHLAEGNVAEALREYESYRRLISAELGVEPSQLIRDLLREIRVAEPRRRRRPSPLHAVDRR